jgi:hypothetical protein|tara:strand:- start:680 stop:1063 length:384 start_codon:yes stop_codon:yes gene_type:complete
MLDLVGKLIDPVSTILDKVIPDKDMKAQLAHEIATMASKQSHEVMLAQLEINREEAKGNWFQSSWRPATAWVCVLGFAVNFLISPLAAPFGFEVPQADMSMMMPVLLGMLGLAGARSFEKVKGVNKD